MVSHGCLMESPRERLKTIEAYSSSYPRDANLTDSRTLAPLLWCLEKASQYVSLEVPHSCLKPMIGLEMAWWLRALAVFLEDLSSISSTYMTVHNCL